MPRFTSENAAAHGRRGGTQAHSHLEQQYADLIKSPADIATLFLIELLALDQEELWVAMLDTKNRLLKVAKVYRGSVNSAQIRIGEVYKEALRLRKEVSEKLKVALRDQSLGLKPNAERQTVGQFLDYWREQLIKIRGRPTTYARYKSIITLHLKPQLGHICLDKLAPKEVQAMFSALRTKPGGRAGATPRPSSAKTVQNIRIVLRAALNQALKWGTLRIVGSA